MLLSDMQAVTSPKSLCLFITVSSCSSKQCNGDAGIENPAKLKQLWELIYYVCMISTYDFFFFFPYFVPLSQKEKIYEEPENTHVLNGLNHPT